ncbi:MAG: hypothetical protein ACJATF_004427 [Flavobacteriales bacterium]|jgi:hypothetical protein
MKRFSQQLGYFLLPMAVLIFPLDYVISNGLKRSHEYNGEIEVWSDIYSGAAKCELAVYGSSRAWVHINSRIVADSLGYSTYNFGLDGHNFNLQFMRHLEYVKHNGWPRNIVLSLDVHSLGGPDEFYQKEQILPFMLWNVNMFESSSSYIGYDWYEYFLPMARYYSSKSCIESGLGFGNRQEESFRHLGYRGMDQDWAVTDSTEVRRTFEAELDTNTVNLYEVFLRNCKQHGTRVVMVYSPEYSLGQDAFVNRDKILETFSILSIEHDVTFLNYSNHPICKEKDWFYNSSHMNSEGADYFSRILCEDLVGLMDRKH